MRANFSLPNIAVKAKGTFKVFIQIQISFASTKSRNHIDAHDVLCSTLTSAPTRSFRAHKCSDQIKYCNEWKTHVFFFICNLPKFSRLILLDKKNSSYIDSFFFIRSYALYLHCLQATAYSIWYNNFQKFSKVICTIRALLKRMWFKGLSLNRNRPFRILS